MAIESLYCNQKETDLSISRKVWKITNVNDYLFENCRGVKKTVRWTVFSHDRRSYAPRTPLWSKRNKASDKQKALIKSIT